MFMMDPTGFAHKNEKFVVLMPECYGILFIYFFIFIFIFRVEGWEWSCDDIIKYCYMYA